MHLLHYVASLDMMSQMIDHGKNYSLLQHNSIDGPAIAIVYRVVAVAVKQVDQQINAFNGEDA